jgi:hypothetical protein
MRVGDHLVERLGASLAPAQRETPAEVAA